MTIYRMSLISTGSISLDSTFKAKFNKKFTVYQVTNQIHRSNKILIVQRQVRIDLSTLLSNKDWEDVRRSLYNKPTFTENCIKRTIINFCQEGSLGNIIRTIQIYTINKSLLLSLRPSDKTVSVTLAQVICISS
jgi:hypothetical protein